jgi:hypothetical protein
MGDPVFTPRTIEDKEGDILIYSDTEVCVCLEP